MSSNESEATVKKTTMKQICYKRKNFFAKRSLTDVMANGNVQFLSKSPAMDTWCNNSFYVFLLCSRVMNYIFKKML